jgi:ClpP class serine protease
MGLSDLFWVFLIFSALQPLTRQKWLEASRLRLLKRLEQTRSSIAIALVHRQELIRAADAIVMDENAMLGPVDPQIGQSPAASLLTVLAHKEPKDIDDQTLILADVACKALAQVRATVRELLSTCLSREQAEALADKISSGTWTHDYPSTAEEAKAMGFPVSTDIPPEIYQLMHLFPQPTHTRPTVEYIPLPHRRGQDQHGA